MNRYIQLFSTLQQKKQGAFIPFVMLGDPTPELSLVIIDCLIENGADALELGIPFSDPLADGPTIQTASTRALSAHVTPHVCFDLIKQIRSKYPIIPLGLLVYANLVFRPGVEQFYQRAHLAGADSILIPDLPLEASRPFRKAASDHQLDQIFICPPNPDDMLLRQLASYGRGYLYLTTRNGVTGIESPANCPDKTIIDTLQRYHSAPLIQGFGISTPKQVKQALQQGCQGAISGSAIVNIIEDMVNDPAQTLNQIAEFTRNMKTATQSLT